MLPVSMSGLSQWRSSDCFNFFASWSRVNLNGVSQLNVMQRIPASAVESKPVVYPLEKAILSGKVEII